MSRKNSSKNMSKTVGVIGLGIMGGSFSRNLVKAGWRVVGFDIDAAKRRELSRAGVEIVADARAVAAAAPDHRGMLDIYDRGQGEGRKDPARGRPHDAGLSGERHRLAGQDRRSGDLRQRRKQSDRQDQTDVRGLFAKAL